MNYLPHQFSKHTDYNSLCVITYIFFAAVSLFFIKRLFTLVSLTAINFKKARPTCELNQNVA